MHIITALILYDAMYTYAGLAKCCLMAEISTKYEDRLCMKRYSQVEFVLDSSAVFAINCRISVKFLHFSNCFC